MGMVIVVILESSRPHSCLKSCPCKKEPSKDWSTWWTQAKNSLTEQTRPSASQNCSPLYTSCDRRFSRRPLCWALCFGMHEWPSFFRLFVQASLLLLPPLQSHAHIYLSVLNSSPLAIVLGWTPALTHNATWHQLVGLKVQIHNRDFQPTLWNLGWFVGSHNEWHEVWRLNKSIPVCHPKWKWTIKEMDEERSPSNVPFVRLF